MVKESFKVVSEDGNGLSSAVTQRTTRQNKRKDLNKLDGFERTQRECHNA